MPKRFCASVRLLMVVTFLAVWIALPGLVSAQSATEFPPVTDAMLQNPTPDDWLMWRRTLDGWGYSPLEEINKDNVKELQLLDLY